MNQIALDLNRPGLVNMGSCNLHICHNIFAVCLKEYGNDISHLMIEKTRNAWYLHIRNHLLRKETLLDLHFLLSVVAVSVTFLQFFQKEEPLIHFL